MRCERCGEKFDERMYGVYSNICPKCGYFNNDQEGWDVSSYFGAEFDDEGKVSTSAQAARQHVEPHKMYDKDDWHKQGVYRHRDTGTVKVKNLVTPICIVIALLVIFITSAAEYIKRVRLTNIYTTLDYEQEFAEPGKAFEINDRMLIVQKAEVVDTSMLDDIPAHIPAEDKLVAVTVEILPAEERNRGKSKVTGLVYLSDGYRCRENLDSYTLGDLLIKEYSEEGEPIYYVTDDIVEELYSINEYDEEEVLTKYDYLYYYYYASEGKTGKFYFLAAKDADEVMISFDLGREKSGISVLEKRVSVPLVLEEEVP